jgi:hypothetical protein
LRITDNIDPSQKALRPDKLGLVYTKDYFYGDTQAHEFHLSANWDHVCGLRYVSKHDQFISIICIPGRQRNQDHLEDGWVKTNFSAEYLDYVKSSKSRKFVSVVMYMKFPHTW